jgi:hypothetical protein
MRIYLRKLSLIHAYLVLLEFTYRNTVDDTLLVILSILLHNLIFVLLDWTRKFIIQGKSSKVLLPSSIFEQTLLSFCVNIELSLLQLTVPR